VLGEEELEVVHEDIGLVEGKELIEG